MKLTNVERVWSFVFRSNKNCLEKSAFPIGAVYTTLSKTVAVSVKKLYFVSLWERNRWEKFPTLLFLSSSSIWSLSISPTEKEYCVRSWQNFNFTRMLTKIKWRYSWEITCVLSLQENITGLSTSKWEKRLLFIYVFN